MTNEKQVPMQLWTWKQVILGKRSRQVGRRREARTSERRRSMYVVMDVKTSSPREEKQVESGEEVSASQIQGMHIWKEMQAEMGGEAGTYDRSW